MYFLTKANLSFRGLTRRKVNLQDVVMAQGENVENQKHLSIMSIRARPQMTSQ
jgi:hypothetical protein